MKNSQLMLLAVLICLASCKGLKFAPASVNAALPGPFKARSVYPSDNAGGYKFQDLTGAIVIIKENTDPLLVGIIRPDSFRTSVSAITDPSTYYKSRIQKGAEAQGSYLQFAASFSAEQMAELELVDAAWAGIEFNTDLPFTQIITKAQAWVQTHPKTDTASKRIWIKEIVLTRRLYTDYTKIKADASGVVGPAVGLKTGVYNTNETHNKSIILGLVAYDIDKMVAQAGSIEGLAGKSDEVMRFSGFPPTYISGKLTNKMEK